MTTPTQARPGTRAKLRVKGPEVCKHFPVYFTADEEKLKE